MSHLGAYMSRQEILWSQTAAYRCGLSLPRHEGRNTLGRHGSRVKRLCDLRPFSAHPREIKE
eukprot:scaffold3019_cov69-Phaeocystis_antarctica.AAC.5